MPLVSLIEKIASEVTAQNVNSFVSLVEQLVSLGESVKEAAAVEPAVTASQATSKSS